MSMMRFQTLFPDVAEKKCQAITLTNHESLPDRTFLFVERYCVEPGCDCRRPVRALSH